MKLYLQQQFNLQLKFSFPTTTISSLRSPTTNLSSNWSEPIVNINGPEEVISEEASQNKHLCDYCKETNYTNPYYDTDFT